MKNKLRSEVSTMIQRGASMALTILTVTVLTVLTGCENPRVTADAEKNGSGVERVALHAVETKGTAQADRATAEDARPIIACFGDSLTAGYGVDAESSYPADLQHDLDAAGYKYRVVNLGISGETTKDGLTRVDRVLALKPAIVVVEFGGNDGLRGVPVTSSRANLDTILNQLVRTGTHVVMAGITLPPQYSAPYIQQFNETYTLLAKKYSVPLLPFLLKDVYGVPGSIQPDGVHPTAQGCKQVARNVMDLIKPLLKK